LPYTRLQRGFDSKTGCQSDTTENADNLGIRNARAEGDSGENKFDIADLIHFKRIARTLLADQQKSSRGYSNTYKGVLDSSGLRLININLTDKVVEAAFQEAIDFQRWPTAYALRTLYDDHRTNPRIVRLIEAIYNNCATEENKIEFRSIMKYKKKKGKKHRTGENYFNGDLIEPAPRTIFSA
jgi:hypothetical protein